MKKIALPLIFAFLTFSARAQNDQASVDFIKAVVHSDQKIIYADSVGNYVISYIKEGLNRPVTSYSQKKKTERQFWPFTRKEKEYINKELSRMQKFTWKDSLLSGSLLVKQDTINAIFSKDVFSGWGYFNTHFGHGFYNLSKPIFLRNRTMCIFYKGYSCGHLCGEGDLTIYVKKKGKWMSKYLLGYWVS